MKIQNYFLAILVIFMLAPILASAAEIHINTESQGVRTGEQFMLNFFLNTEESVNALEGQIVFPADLLEPKEIRDGNSIINLWIERPKIESDKIYFSGITPGGFKGKNGLIFSVIFEAQKEGWGFIEFQDVKTLLNDGKGTSAEVKFFNFQFDIKDVVGHPDISDSLNYKIEDAEPPETFQPEIAKDAELFNGKYFLVFASQDKSSGISHYEVRESRQGILSVFKRWVLAKSPYVLADQELRSYILVKAVDKAGNKRIISIAPRNPLAWYKNYENWIIIIVGLVIAYALKRFYGKST